VTKPRKQANEWGNLRIHRSPGMNCKELTTVWSKKFIKFYLKIQVLTNSMDQSVSWKADSRSAGQESIRLLWNSKIHKSPLTFSNLCQIIQSTPSQTIYLRSILILSSNLRLVLPSVLFPSFTLSSQNIARISVSISHACYVHLFLDYPNILLFGEGYCTLICSFSHAILSSLPLLTFRYKYFPQRLVLKQPQSMLFPAWGQV
jgi:hypothetical protein